MKKTIWYSAFLLVNFSAQAYLYNYARSLLDSAYAEKDTLNRSADNFRLVVKAFYMGKSIFGGSGFSGLQKEYLLPPDDVVSNEIRQKLKYYSTALVTSVEPRIITEALRKDANLGKEELQFIANRLKHAVPVFSKADQDILFIAPDTNTEKNPTPYGYALDRGLNSVLQTPENIPRIGVCFSGGGFRAMVATLGFLQAASDTGIVDSFLYNSNLSGSTWCSMPWAVGASLQELFLTYEKYARVGVSSKTIGDLQRYVLPFLNMGQLKNKFITAFLWDQPLSSVREMWGPLIGQMTMSFWQDNDIRAKSGTQFQYQSSQYLYLWQASEFIKDGTRRPFPVATALIPLEGTNSKMAKKQKVTNGLWMEFNPEYVGFEYLDSKQRLTGVWMPSFALGRTFSGKVKEASRWYRIFTINPTVLGYESPSGPVQTMDYWMGTWGSAFTVSAQDLFRIMFKQKNIEVPQKDFDSLQKKGAIAGNTEGMNSNDQGKSIGSKLVSLLGETVQFAAQVSGKQNSLGGMRLYPARFNNFAQFPDSPLAKSHTFMAVDAGIDFNLPLPPLLRPGRDLDLIIVGDWSQATPKQPAKELVLAEVWAAKRGVPFPKIQSSKLYNSLYSRPMTLFNEYSQGQTGPAILYIPLMDNQFNEKDFSVATCFEGACSTFNFDYFPKNKDGSLKGNYIAKLSNHIYRTVWGVYPQIRQVVQAMVDAKNTNQSFDLKELDATLIEKIA